MFSPALCTQHSALFITGTGTGVGKSILTAILALQFYNLGKKVAIFKPIQTGTPKDTDLLVNLTGNKIPVFNTYSFSLPAAPLVASEEENKIIDIKKIVLDLKKIEKEFDSVIIEGIGGIAVPITEVSTSARGRTRLGGQHYLIADLIKELNYPVIIVARSSLGTINHTVLTIEFAKQKGLNILGFVVSGYDGKTNDVVIRTAPDVISRMTGIQCLFKIPLLEHINYGMVSRVNSLYRLWKLT